jgi:16S rRNA (uracil1498-N3)-methyltransferase
MPQFLVSPEQIRGDRFWIRGAEAHHIVNVLRKKAGDAVTVFDGSGHRFHGKITQCNETDPYVEGILLELIESPSTPSRLTLFQGLSRAAKFDTIIEKSTELGVAEIISFISSKSVVRLEKSLIKEKRERWQRIAEAASKQCRRSDVPSVTGPLSLQALAERLNSGLSFLFWEKEAAQSLKSVAREMTRPPAASIIVGSEGGFSEDEAALLKRAGAKSVSLGKRILRTETVAPAALAILSYEWDLF